MKKVLEDLRRVFFWALDGLNGGVVKRHYNDIDKVILEVNETVTDKAINDRLELLLDHATATTQFYKSRMGSQTLSDFPVVNKTVIRNSERQFCSDRFDHKEVIPVVTSGSTSTPFRVFHDRNKKHRNS